MKIILFILLGLLMLGLTFAYPLTLIGWLIGGYGYYQNRKRKNGEPHLARPKLIAWTGLIVVFIIAFSMTPHLSPNSFTTVKNVQSKKTEQVAEENDHVKKTSSIPPVQDKLKTVTPIETTSSPRTIPAHVVRIVDGDTFKVLMNGREETIRLILVDTPETKHPLFGVQPYGPEASAFTKKTLTGKDIQIEPGIDQRDQYGRLLAYIYVGDKMFNKMLLEKGYARVAVYPPNTKYLNEFKQIEQKAKGSEIGIWQYENYVTEKGYNVPKKNGEITDEDSTAVSPQSTSQPSTKKTANATKPSSTGTAPEYNPEDDFSANSGCKDKIKGNNNSMIYHLPNGAFYDKTVDHIHWFCSTTEAEAAGYRASKR
jgi:micrococcal nuclease